MENIPFQVDHKSHKEIDNDRGTESKKGQVNEIQPDAGSGNIEFFPKIRAYAKSVILNKTAETVHKRLKLVTINKNYTTI